MSKTFAVITAAASFILLSGAALAQPAGTTAVCKDGTYSSAASKRGACSGHKGVGQWLAGGEAGAMKAPATQTAAPAAAPAPAPFATTAPHTVAAAAPGGFGQVWVNTASKVYHCQGDRYYGKTKAGSYMTEAAAVAAGDRPDHGKACH